ncbi:MAG: hypothetical protein A2W91_18700 [Bacteroidetes bacterium GWF2_38_335]|nr:MAG: hypothetical protein A2W91_18700 [Bacteroidetes bacterium GWF2_38_335]OFY78224.1 MAG: hypothetical protein A2281_04365 [Bacteroidetes bacterium RIFOXYA12_FULL_38_20]
MESRKEIYSSLCDRYTNEISGLRKKIRVVSLLRLVVFLSWAAAFYFSLKTDLATVFIVFILFAGVFIFLLRWSSALSYKLDFARALFDINNNEMKALNRDLSAFDCGKKFVDSDHPFSGDMDIFGEESLYQYINRTCTSGGSEILAGMLSMPLKSKKLIVDRQEAVKELANDLDFRQRFIATGMIFKESDENRATILKWAAGEPHFLRKKIYGFIAFFVPTVTIISLILVVAGLLPLSVLALCLTAQWTISVANLRKVNSIHQSLGKKLEILFKYARLSELIEKKSFYANLLISLKAGIDNDHEGAGQNIRNLAGLMNAFDSRLNMFVGIILNSILLWDLQCVLRLEKWQIKNRDNIKMWIEVIAQIDALESLSGYAYNNPEYVFPEIDDSSPVWIFKDSGHPLLNPENRVCNNFSIEDYGNFQIITGANMAGKSTFLRTVGVNLVFGMAGVPVCASYAKIYPVEIFTSMRTSDSLQKNESYFYAELKRLKELADILKNGEERFIILDEILKGTNSQDKQTGSRAFMEKLIEHKGSGIIATHDISLGELEMVHPGKIKNMCFEIEINGSEIFFDYKLYNGITKKMNASLLMKQMGIV